MEEKDKNNARQKTEESFLTYEMLLQKTIILLPSQSGNSRYESVTVTNGTILGNVEIHCLIPSMPKWGTNKIKRSKYDYIFMIKKDYDDLPEEIRKQLIISEMMYDWSRGKSKKKPAKKPTEPMTNMQNKTMIWGASRTTLFSLLNNCVIPTSLTLRNKTHLHCFLCTKNMRPYITLEEYNALASDIKDLLDYQGEDEFLSTLLNERISAVSKGQTAAKQKVDKSSMETVGAVDRLLSKSHRKKKEKSISIENNEKKVRKATILSGKIVLTDDSIIPRCKSASILVEDKKYSVIGYISKTTGSLLIPASIFLKNVPMDSWSKLKLSDPKKLLPQQGFRSVSFDVDENDLQECSILFKYGYSVKKSVPFDVRRKALNTAIMDHAVTKEQAIQHIKRLITLNRNRYPDACARWRDDIEYLEQMMD